MELDLRRLIVRDRSVAPMMSALLAGTDARVRILDADERAIVDRQGGGFEGEVGRHPVTVGRRTIGWVEGGRVAGAIAAVLSYAANREADKRSLSQEALDRYRELTLIYDLAGRIGERLEVSAVARVALDELLRLPGGGAPFLLLRSDGAGGLVAPGSLGAEMAVSAAAVGAGIVGAVAAAEAEIVNDVAADPRRDAAERDLASLMAAPLVVRGERLGVLGVGTAERHEYRAGDLRVLEAIAALTAPAIAQARASVR